MNLAHPQSLARAWRALVAFALFVFAAAAYAQPAVTAAIHWPNGKAQFFLSNGTYIRYDIAADRADAGYPKAVDDKTWPGLGPYAGLIIAALNGADAMPGKAYFFLSDGRYLRYDIPSDRVDPGYPKPVDDQTWPGMGAYAQRITGAVKWHTNRAYFTLDDGTYIRYDFGRDRVDAGYPRPIDDRTWPGLVQYATAISCMLNWDNGKVYIFLDNGFYLRYDVAGNRVDEGYPKRINEANWPGMGRLFQRHRRPRGP